MRLLITIGFFLCFTIAVWADQVLLINNVSITGSVTSITADAVTIRSDDNKEKSFKRSSVEKIIYSNGKTVTFYDQVFLHDGSIIKGRILRRTALFVEINPEGTIPFDKILRSKIEKILYDSGKEEKLTSGAVNNGSDSLCLHDGRILQGKVHTVSGSTIRYTPLGKEKQVFLPKKQVEKIIYADGKEVRFSSQTPLAAGNLDTSNLWVDLEVGWNGYVGLGPRFDYRVFDNIALNAGLGISLWGWRLSTGARYYFTYPYGWAVGLGVSYSVGSLVSSDIELETVDASGEEHDEDVNIDLEPVTVLNASIIYFWRIAGNRRFYVEFGYGYALDDDPYNYDSQSGNKLSQDSKDTLDFLSPGGIMLSFGFSLQI